MSKRAAASEGQPGSAEKKSNSSRRCVCGDAKCAKLTADLERLANDRGGYETLPVEPKKPLAVSEAYVRKTGLRRGILRHLGIAAKHFCGSGTEDQGGSTKQHFVSRIHWHPLLTALCPDSAVTKLTVTREYGQAVDFTEADLLYTISPEKGYLPLPNRTIKDAEDELYELRHEASRRVSGAAATPSPPSSSSSSRRIPVAERVSQKVEEDLVAQMAAMLRENSILETRLKKSEEERIAAVKSLAAADKKSALELAAAKQQAKEDLRAWQVVNGGISRINLTSDAWHAANPQAASHLFGFGSWQETKVYVRCFWPNLKLPDTSTLTDDVDILPVEKCLITKMRFQKRFQEETLARMFGRERTTINGYIQIWAPKWGKVGLDLSILDINEAYLTAEMPQAFKDQKMDRVGALVDGKDFGTDTTRGHTAMTRAMRSDKISHSGARCNTWGTAAGLTFEHTALFMARATEGRLVALWRRALAKIPRGRAILADRGFFRDALLYPNFNPQLTPHFLSGRARFTAGEVICDRRVCELRYGSETSFSRVTDTEGLRDIIPRGFFSIMQDMCDWGHAHANLCAPFHLPGGAPAGYF